MIDLGGVIRQNYCPVEIIDRWSGEVEKGQVYGRTYDAPADIKYVVLLDDGKIEAAVPPDNLKCSRSFCDCECIARRRR